MGRGHKGYSNQTVPLEMENGTNKTQVRGKYLSP